MKIKTTRFGELEVDKKDIIEFTEGLLGFENLKKFFVVMHLVVMHLVDFVLFGIIQQVLVFY